MHIIKGGQDLVTTGLEAQNDMKRLVGTRSICHDAYGHDYGERKHDMEIQRADSGTEFYPIESMNLDMNKSFGDIEQFAPKFV